MEPTKNQEEYEARVAEMTKSVRTVATVGEGIKERIDRGYAMVVVYEPGNGVRYRVVLTALSPEQARVFGAEAPCFAVSLPGFRAGSMVLSVNPGWLDSSYVEEKLDVASHHAVAITELLCHLTGREGSSAEDWAELEVNRMDLLLKKEETDIPF